MACCPIEWEEPFPGGLLPESDAVRQTARWIRVPPRRGARRDRPTGPPPGFSSATTVEGDDCPGREGCRRFESPRRAGPRPNGAFSDTAHPPPKYGKGCNQRLFGGQSSERGPGSAGVSPTARQTAPPRAGGCLPICRLTRFSLRSASFSRPNRRIVRAPKRAAPQPAGAALRDIPRMRPRAGERRLRSADSRRLRQHRAGRTAAGGCAGDLPGPACRSADEGAAGIRVEHFLEHIEPRRAPARVSLCVTCRPARLEPRPACLRIHRAGRRNAICRPTASPRARNALARDWRWPIPFPRRPADNVWTSSTTLFHSWP